MSFARQAWLLLVATAVVSEGNAQETLRVHLIGAGEYKPVESLTEFKKVLEQQYKLQVTTSFGKDSKSLPNLESLKSADVMLLYVRRMNLPPEQMEMLRDFWEKGKGIVALRTASHAFQTDDIAAFNHVLGGAYTGPGDYSFPYKAIAVASQTNHPVLKGVGTIQSKGPYFYDKFAEKTVILQVVESNRKVPAPATWVHEYKGGRVFYSSMGVPEDFQNDDFRRLLVNAIFWTGRRDLAK